MLLIKCPYCEEERPELEFRNAGEAHLVRANPIVDQSDDDFAAFLYFRQNPKGLQFERWRHIHGCGRFFNAVRDSVSDKFLTVYKAGEPKPNVEQLVTRGTTPAEAVVESPAPRTPRAKKAEA
ncbi:sarcosine oxidase subunit delta [Phyllobacterium sp. SYP-B3895]|jgi:sarcosine oxidase subunit delta|uniref:sarcosine oxidase subunit delta n=1 Tax=Phyllobacterium TaxID=28100 RepID=UPI0008E95096|nr:MULTISPECIES: sarcosine oxidase subunit delta [unclassified Phyllobacterium]MRG56443.1 sarcosine oxidase subunit delta [Phyllobacterium sp. SYP-B3895]UGY09606.1 sarcosine oxidase subunit delta [Phyllobacterium sp. T1018]SFJ53043.1 sarcosine oxidase subunit delta [Phyllobacterium sp. CL33Tsu]